MSAPTAALKSVFITSTIGAKESRKVVTVDVPGSFLHTDNKDYIVMKMVGMLAELLVKTNGSYTNNMQYWRKAGQCSIYNYRRSYMA